MKTGAGIKVIKVTGCEMGRANFFIKKAAIMMESGKITICMGLANFTIPITS